MSVIKMGEQIVLVDFAGTLIKSEIIEEANEFRSNVLERSLPKLEEHSNPKKLYENNREFVEKLTGITSDMKILYLDNGLDLVKIKGESYQNQISTNLFQIGMFMVAKKYGLSIFPDGFIDELLRIKKLGYKLAIVSGVRTDIISGMMQISDCPVKFDYIYAQPPILGVTNQKNMETLSSHGSIDFVIGDKYDDLDSASDTGAKLIFANWGHASGNEESICDYKINNASELKEIIK